jgi:predicted ABC-type ATPase
MIRQSEKIIIIARPNGAGKTTFANEFLLKEANCRTFVNADLIAAGLAPFEPEQVAFRAGRLMLEEIFNHALRGVSFAFETTLSGRGFARLIPGWQMDGYIVKLTTVRLNIFKHSTTSCTY